jgi:cell division protease FtsH
MMVTELGMSELGPIKYDSGQDAVFLGRDYSRLSNTHSSQIAFEIDQQVRKIIEDAHKQATDIINAQKDKLELIANALLENETLNAEQITALYETGKMPETFDGDNTEEVEEPVKETPVSTDDDLLDEMK